MQGEFVLQARSGDRHEALHASSMDISLDELHLDQTPMHMSTLNGKTDDSVEMEDEDCIDFDQEGEQEVDQDDEWSEEDDIPTQYDLRQYGVYQSLPIPLGPPNMESDCDTAEEYLRRVRYEAERLPQTVTSHIDPRAYDAQRTHYVPVQEEEPITAAGCIPNEQWLIEFLTDFAALRSRLHREDEELDPFLPKAPPPPPPHPLPLPRDKIGWQKYCLGTCQAAHHGRDSAPDTAQDAAAMDALQSAHEPEVMIDNGPDNHQAQATAQELPVAASSSHVGTQAAVAAAGEGHDASMQETESRQQAAATDLAGASETMDISQEAAVAGHAPQMAVLASLDQVFINHLLQWQVNWATAASDLPDLSTRWLYALMAQLEKPIAVDSSSQLSKLLRHCLQIRKQISDDNNPRLLSLHMLTALAGAYFGQDGVLASYMQPGWL